MIAGLIFGGLGFFFFRVSALYGLIYVISLLSVSWDILNVVLNLELFNITGQKLALLVATLPLLRRGILTLGLYLPVLLIVIFSFQSLYVDNLLSAFFALISKAYPLLLLGAIFTNYNAFNFIKALSYGAIFAVLVGLCLSLVSDRMLITQDYSGTYRLQGGLVASHLTFLAYFASLASLYLSKSSKYYNIIFVINLIILVLTGSRTGLICIILFLLLISKEHIKSLLNLRVKKSIFFILLLGIPFLIIATSIFLQRSAAESGEQYLLSGRLYAWEFFYQRFLEKPYFGYGLGSAQYANQDNLIHSGFIAPHNEYVGFLYEVGFIGLIGTISFFILYYRAISRRVDSKTKQFLTSFFISFAVFSFADNTLSTPQSIYCFSILVASFMAVGKQKVVKNGKQ